MSTEDYYIYEFRVIGELVKISAMDPATLTEISVSLPKSYSRQFMINHARNRLNYRLGKIHQEQLTVDENSDE